MGYDMTTFNIEDRVIINDQASAYRNQIGIVASIHVTGTVATVHIDNVSTAVSTKDLAKLDNPHICQQQFVGRTVGCMKDLYRVLGLLATSTCADIVLIRSHIAYWSGNQVASDAVIKTSRGHSYSVTDRYGRKVIVKIANYFDHRDGVTGWN